MSAHTMSTRHDIEGIVSTHQVGLWRYLRLLGCDSNEAEDLAQETFVVVLRKDFEHKNDAATARYLRTTARFLFLKSLRQKRKRALVDSDLVDLVWEEEIGDDDGNTLRDSLHECLEGLDQRQRQLIDMRYFKQADRSEIARALEITVVGVKSLLRRVKMQLRKCVEARRSAS